MTQRVSQQLGLHVKTATLQPSEQPTPLVTLRSKDIYRQIFIKYSKRGTFHSYPELLHAALLEADPSVETFIPHPFRLTIGSSSHIPTLYLVRNGERIVREIRSNSHFPEEWKAPLTEFWKSYGIKFEIIASQDICAREIEALNWLEITQTLVSGASQDTSLIEDEVASKIACAGSLTLIEVLPDNDNFARFGTMLAIYRLLHRGRLFAQLCTDVINYQTELKYVA